MVQLSLHTVVEWTLILYDLQGLQHRIVTTISKIMKLNEMRRMIFEDLQYLNREKVLIKCMTELDEKDVAVSKNISMHESSRRNANELFLKNKNNDFALNHRNLLWYNECIALAPNNSEALAITYGNKSALLLRMRKYQECICEIDRALNITESVSLRIKLLCRKAECLTALELPDNRSCLEKARFYVTKLKDTEKMKKMLNKLIQKSQSVIDESKLDKPKENRRKMQVSKFIAEAETMSPWDAVKVEYSEIYGKHLVAARDFEAGDIVLAVKPYRNQVDDSKHFQYCYTCFSYLWTAVPCDTCSIRLFCSEQCKNEAVDEYHGMECPVIDHLCSALRTEMSNTVQLLVTIFCKAYREAGSLDQMRTDIESLDKSEDQYIESISLDKIFKDYRSIYTLRYRKFAKTELEEGVRNACVTLMGLAKYTNIFGRTYGFNEVKKLMKNDAAIFVGALLLKFNLVTVTGLTIVKLPDPTERYKESNPPEPLGKDLVVEPVTMMSHVGCIPNVHNCTSSGVKVICFALQPIKAGDEICMCWTASIYTSLGASKFVRQMNYFKMYSCPCVCRACTENWSDTLVDSTKLAAADALKSGLEIAKQLRAETIAISAEYDASSNKPNQPDIKLVCRIRDLARRVWKHYSIMPSSAVSRAVALLAVIYADFVLP